MHFQEGIRHFSRGRYSVFTLVLTERPHQTRLFLKKSRTSLPCPVQSRSENALAGRPVHSPSAKQVDVKVVNCLTAIGPGVDHRPKSIRQPLAARNSGGDHMKMPQQGRVLGV